MADKGGFSSAEESGYNKDFHDGLLDGKRRAPSPPLCCLLFPNDDRFDEIPRFIAHHKERFFDVIHAFKDVGDFLMEIEATARDKARQFFHAQPSARHETAGNGLVRHASAPFHARDLDIVSGTEVVNVANPSAWLQALDGFAEGIHVAAGNADAVHTGAICPFQDLCKDGAILVA